MPYAVVCSVFPEARHPTPEDLPLFERRLSGSLRGCLPPPRRSRLRLRRSAGRGGRTAPRARFFRRAGGLTEEQRAAE